MDVMCKLSLVVHVSINKSDYSVSKFSGLFSGVKILRPV